MDIEAMREWEFWETLSDEDRVINTEGTPPYSAAEVGWLVQGMLGRLTPEKVVLDLGCGMGRLSIVIHRLTRCDLHCVDISAAMLSVIGGSKTNIYLHLGDGRTIPDAVPRQLDAAYSVAMFQHIPPEAQLSYIRQVSERLRPGARFAFTLAIDSSSSQFLDHRVSWGTAFDWCKEVGLRNVDEFIDARRWAWFVAVKL